MWRNTSRQTGANEAQLGQPRRWGNSLVQQQPQGGPPPSRFDQQGPPGGFGGSRFDDRGPPSRFDDRSGGSRFDDRGPPSNSFNDMPPPQQTFSAKPAKTTKLPPAIAAAIEAAKAKEAEEKAKLEAASADGGPKKRKSRWGEKVETSGMPTAIQSNVPKTELESYAISLRLEEINRKLRMGEYVPEERDRSPSPPPSYDSHGRRTNTREVRYRKKMQGERDALIEKAMRNDPMFRPPQDYLNTRKMGGRPQEKVFIPVKEFPEINFFGLLVGPRGNSLKKMERESGAKISIRGKGSVKEGKSRPDGMWGSTDDDNEDLHCLVVADTEDKVRKCVELINQVIEVAASTPEGDNDWKRTQLRELAMLNGTLRDDENQVCQNCGNIGHRKYDCPEQRNFTANIICRVCGQAGHMARDCMQRKQQQMGQQPGFGGPQQITAAPPGNAQFDSDYASLMAELGEMPVGGDPNVNGGAGPMPTGTVAPWRIPSNWHPPQAPNQRPANTGYNNYGVGQVGQMYGAQFGGYAQPQMA